MKVSSALLLAVLATASTQVVQAGPLSAPAARFRCSQDFPAAARMLDRTLSLAGNGETRLEVPAPGASDALVYAFERGVDVEIESSSGNGAIARSDNPVARTGIQRMVLPAGSTAPVSLTVRGREHEGVSGTVRVLMIRLGSQGAGSSCPALERALASADMALGSSRLSVSHDSDVAAATHPRAQLEKAAAGYESVAQIAGASHHLVEQGEAQLALASLLYYDLQDWTNSAAWAERAAATLDRAAMAYESARAQAVLASAWLEMATKSASSGQTVETPADSRSRLDRARALLGRLEQFHAERNEPYDRALQANNIGLAYLYESRFEPAIGHFTRAQVYFERLHETQRISVALLNIGLCEWGLGRLSAAVPRLDRALGLMKPEPYTDLYLATLFNNALVHYAAGRFDDSLRLHGQGLELATRLGMDRARGRTYYGMGVTYYAIGDRDLAVRFLRSALEILEPDVDARVRVAGLRALAVIEHEMGQYASATLHDSEALRLATAPSARSRILLRLAADYFAQKDAKAALGLLNPLIAVAPNADTLVQAMARSQRARIYRASGDLEEARQDARAAIDTLRSFEAVTEEFEALVELARIEHEAGNDPEALAVVSRALELTEEITAQTVNPEYRASIAQSIRPALDLKIDLLWRRHERFAAQGNTAAARAVALESLRTADDSRALAFEQVRAQRLEGGADPKLAALQRTVGGLYRDIAERRFQLSTREDRIGANDEIARSLREDIVRLRARLGVANAELAARAAPQPRTAGGASKAGVEGLLAARPDRAFIEYWVGEDDSYAWALFNGQIAWQRLAPSAQIVRAARGLHEAMRSYATVPVRDRLNQSAELYGLTIAPLRSKLLGAQQLVIVPDGPLHYVPFATLRDATSATQPYLVQRFDLAFAPALRLVSHAAQRKPQVWRESRLLLVADPVYGQDDPRMGRTVRTRTNEMSRLSEILRMRGGVDPAHLERLVSSALESERIRALAGFTHVDVLEGFDATRANVLAQDLTRYRFIHIASHGIIDAEIPQLSALILGAWGREGRVDDQYVRAGDLMGRTFNAEVVVLSACDTALGREFAGEGLIGLRYAALARGAHSVVGSLWPVSDAIAADLMTDMYRYITIEGQRVESALGAAIRTVLTQMPSLDPALWGPFAAYVTDD